VIFSPSSGPERLDVTLELVCLCECSCICAMIADNKIGDEGAKAIAAGLTQLTTLNLAGDIFSQSPAFFLALVSV
jgi:hypothetical protein